MLFMSIQIYTGPLHKIKLIQQCISLLKIIHVTVNSMVGKIRNLESSFLGTIGVGGRFLNLEGNFVFL